MYSKGKIILVPFPFTDLSGGKVKPALIISKEGSESDVVVLFITSKAKTSRNKHRVLIKPDNDNGIKVTSHIVCNKIATLDKKIILGELGVVSKTILGLVDLEVKKLLNLK